MAKQQRFTECVICILRSDTGTLYEIPVNPSILIGTIKESLTTVTGIQPNEQILLADTNLSSNRSLESYNIVKDREIYLFNKRILDNPSYYPEDVNLALNDFNVPRLPTPKNLKELETSLNPLNKLFTLEFYLNNHVVGTQYLKEVYENKVVQCMNSLSELNIQKKCISAALNSLDDYKNKLLQNYSNLSTSYKKQAPGFESLLLSFETDLNRLKQVKLHESLRYPNRQTLLDCIPENEIRKWSEQCKREYETLKSKLGELGYQIDSIMENVDSELKKTVDTNFMDLNERITFSRENTKQIQALHQSTLSNSEKIKRSLESSRNSKDPNQISSILMSFSEIKNSQDTSIQSSLKNIEHLSSTLLLFQKAKNYMNHFVFSTLRNISKLQAKMHELINSFSIWNDAINKQSTNFFQLECIHHMPSAYEDALTETSRRIKFGTSIGSNLNRFLDSLNSIRDEENAKRQTFFERIYQYLPPNIFQSLKEQLPAFHLSLPPFDTQLLQINNTSSNIINNSGTFMSDSAPRIKSVLSQPIIGFQQQQQQQQTGSNNSGGNSDVEDDFALIDGFDQINMNRTNPNNKKTDFSTGSTFVDKSSNLDSKILESQQKEKIKSLEMKLQSTFLMASKADEKYRDLLEKSRIFQSDSVTSDQFRKNQIEEVRKELDDKKQELSKLLLESASQQKHIDTLQSHESELSNKIREHELENTIKKKQIEELETKIQQLKQEKEDKQDEDSESIELLTVELKKANTDKQELSNDVKELKQQIARHEQFIEISNSSSIESQESNTKLLNEKSTIIGHLENKVLGLGNELESGKIAIVNLNDLLKQSEKEVRRLEESTKMLEEKIASMDKTIAKQSSDYTFKISELTSQLDDLSEERSHGQVENEDLRYESEKLTRQLKVANEELATMRMVLDAKSSESVDSIERLNSTLQEYEKELDKSHSRLTEMMQAKEQLQKELEDALDTIRSKDTIISIVQNQMNDLTNDMKQKDEIISSSELQLKENEVTIKENEATIKENEVAIKTLEGITKKLQSERSEIEQNSSESIHKSQIELDQHKEEQKSMRAIVDTMQERVQNMTKQLAERDEAIKKNLSDFENQNFTHQTEIDSFKAVIAEHSSTITQHTSTIAQQQSDIESLTSENANVTAELERSQATIEMLQTENQDLDQQLNVSKSSGSNEKNTLLAKIKELQRTLEHNVVQMETLKEQTVQQNQKIQKLEAQYESTNVNYVNSLHQVEKLQESLSEKDVLCTSLDQELEKKEKDLASKTEDANKSNASLRQISNIVLGQRPGEISHSLLVKSLMEQKENILTLENTLEGQTNHIRDLNDKIRSLESLSVDILMNNQNDENAILANFRHSKTAIFYFVKNNVYEAVNINSPNYYLSPDCLDSFQDEVAKKSCIIGTIIEINTMNADSSNIYGLPTGTTYHELLVAKSF
ncbi:hypothetical protein DFA_09016 [Cavenderia fasciculata]|uniref:Ubiquitin-like domain-containing protein n=1 Tax=Cavenderia fasciculata TaxID=261658 RepID=F4Q6G8_CACFS|nr:uncharacterized protein DFA_09016 [Cavenderia fasciculata]EGG16478.1 hypothetical protein DFA_09016 [Cavenderia fasciculata]|eukprot:XP_004354878.1 hypothetical protein DFA_09016 [Cavenderia fasciculata]